MRDAERRARKFVRERTPYAHWHFDIALEHDGESRKSWSFGLTPDEEDPEFIGVESRNMPHIVGYVHADGSIEGLY
jgi:hypothetical protein